MGMVHLGEIPTYRGVDKFRRVQNHTEGGES